jgi:hypothetical protein
VELLEEPESDGMVVSGSSAVCVASGSLLSLLLAVKAGSDGMAVSGIAALYVLFWSLAFVNACSCSIMD